MFKGPHSTIFIRAVPKDHLPRGIPLKTEAREAKPRDHIPASSQKPRRRSVIRPGGGNGCSPIFIVKANFIWPQNVSI